MVMVIWICSPPGGQCAYDGVFWLEQVRTSKPMPRFKAARDKESEEWAYPEVKAWTGIKHETQHHRFAFVADEYCWWGERFTLWWRKA